MICLPRMKAPCSTKIKEDKMDLSMLTNIGASNLYTILHKLIGKKLLGVWGSAFLGKREIYVFFYETGNVARVKKYLIAKITSFLMRDQNWCKKNIENPFGLRAFFGCIYFKAFTISSFVIGIMSNILWSVVISDSSKEEVRQSNYKSVIHLCLKCTSNKAVVAWRSFKQSSWAIDKLLIISSHCQRQYDDEKISC